MKIVILGQSGSGKSTLARTIQETAKIPLLPLDFYGMVQIIVKRHKFGFN